MKKGENKTRQRMKKQKKTKKHQKQGEGSVRDLLAKQ